MKKIQTTTTPRSGSATEGIDGWPKEVREIKYTTEADNSRQPALFYEPQTDEPKPLLVALHTWSYNYRQPEPAYAQWCIQHGWCFMHPDFRGPNCTPEALGSELVVQDIVSAVRHATTTCMIDAKRIYLIGVSGGGHAALLMAGRRPDIWAGVSAWCGIFDVRTWWEETKAAKRGYSEHVEKACGGPPDTDTRAAAECYKRSPCTYLNSSIPVNLDINAGVKDGRAGSVPFTQSLHAFNASARVEDRISARDIEQFYQDMKAPPHIDSKVTDPLYGEKRPLFRKISKNIRITIFDGGHEIIHPAALNWLAQQRKDRPAEWDIKSPSQFKTSAKDAQSGL